MSKNLNKTLKWLISLLIPIIILGGAVRALATDRYLFFEYGKASFPPDEYGLSPQERFNLASADIHYVRAHLPENALSSQILAGAPAYNLRELAHMVDVRSVFQAALRTWQVGLLLLLLLGFLLARTADALALAMALRSGGLLTCVIIASIALLALFAWQTWFELFHRFFFVPGSWLFSSSDTLIRLFPFEFWSDATLTISAFGLVAGLLVAFMSWCWQSAIEKSWWEKAVQSGLL